MSPLVREVLLKGLMAGTAMHTAKKTSVSVAYYAAAGGAALLAFVFFSIAGYALLLESFTMPVAAAITGLAILGLAGAIAFTGYIKVQNKRVVKKAPLDGNFLDSIEHTAKSLLAGFEGPVKDNPTMAVLLAALAGFAAADQIGEKMEKYH